MSRASVRSGLAVRLRFRTEREPLGTTVTNTFDVSPDGQRFLFTRAVGSGAAKAQRDRIVIVQNFVAELKTTVGE